MRTIYRRVEVHAAGSQDYIAPQHNRSDYCEGACDSDVGINYRGASLQFQGTRAIIDNGASGIDRQHVTRTDSQAIAAVHDRAGRGDDDVVGSRNRTTGGGHAHWSGSQSRVYGSPTELRRAARRDKRTVAGDVLIDIGYGQVRGLRQIFAEPRRD